MKVKRLFTKLAEKWGLYAGEKYACFFAWEEKKIFFWLGAKKKVCTGEKNHSSPMYHLVRPLLITRISRWWTASNSLAPPDPRTSAGMPMPISRLTTDCTSWWNLKGLASLGFISKILSQVYICLGPACCWQNYSPDMSTVGLAHDLGPIVGGLLGSMH